MNFQKPVTIGIDARMYSTRFTGIGRYVHELTDHLFELRPDWNFTLFVSPEVFETCNFPANVQKVLAPERHYSLGEQTSFLQKINKNSYDLFHFPHFNAPLLYHGKSIVTIHDLTLSFFPGKKKTSFLHRLGYRTVLKNIVRKAERVITVSDHTKKDLQQLLQTPEKKIRTIWNGLGAEFQRENQNPQEIAESWKILQKKHQIKKPYFLYTGVHRDHKNILGMLKAFRKFLQKDHTAQLVITGKPDPLYLEIPEYIKTHNLSGSVKRVGLVSEEELKALFWHAHAFCFPSFYEGFGLPPLEAMAMEIPVLASNTSSMPEVCGDAAAYFAPSNVTEMSEKMERVFTDNKTRQQLIAAGKKRIQLFSWEKMAAETLNAYEEILSL